MQNFYIDLATLLQCGKVSEIAAFDAEILGILLLAKFRPSGQRVPYQGDGDMLGEAKAMAWSRLTNMLIN